MARNLKAEQLGEPGEDYVAAVFGRGGALARTLDGYQVRVGQVELACAADECMRVEGGGTVLAEAPTGTGKSLAYCVPASWRAAHLAQRTVIATANIALQEQLVTKDLPLLERALPWEFRYALAKGINNYLCLDAFEDAEGDLLLRGGERVLGPELARQWDEVRRWADSTRTGDLSELPFEPGLELRRLVTTTSDDCVGRKCREHDRCHAMRAREAARAADVVVTNYHLFFADLSVKLQSDGGQGILAPYRHVVFDEGHEAADIARGFFGFRVTEGSVRWAVRMLGGAAATKRRAAVGEVDARLKARVAASAEGMFRRLKALRASKEYEARLVEAGQVAAEPLAGELKAAGGVLRQASESGSVHGEHREEMRKAADRCERIADALEAAAKLEHEDDRVYYLDEAGQRGEVALAMKPIDVSGYLREALFENPGLGGRVVTSATLSAGGRDGFGLVARELGADEADTLEVESPFDHEEQAVLVVPRGVPAPVGRQAERFPGAVAEVLLQCVRLSRGRLLGLFTSYKALDVAHRRLADAGLPWRVMRQGEAPRTQLIRAFKEDESSVLLGTASFWQGVDVPGAALSVVFVDKLPFEPPDDPVMDAVAARDDRWFKRYMLPRAVIALKQGVGRLIRTTSDRGAVVVCDRRIVEKGYGRLFVRALPEMPLRRDLEVIGEYT